MSTRMKTPLLGTFALCWLLYNHDHVAKLIFSDNTQRLALIEQTPVNLMSDFVIPLGLSLVYIFIIPLVQWGIDVVKYRFIEKPRTVTNYSHQLDKYRGLTKVAQQQSKTSLEYWQEVHRNNADKAGKQIIDLSGIISSQTSENKKLTIDLKVEKKNNESLTETNNTLREDLRIAQESEVKYREMYKKTDEEVYKYRLPLEKIRDLLLNATDIDVESNKHLDKLLGEVLDSFKRIGIQQGVETNSALNEVFESEKLNTRNNIEHTFKVLAERFDTQGEILQDIIDILEPVAPYRGRKLAMAARAKLLD